MKTLTISLLLSIFYDRGNTIVTLQIVQNLKIWHSFKGHKDKFFHDYTTFFASVINQINTDWD